jgi:hypothetical protein
MEGTVLFVISKLITMFMKGWEKALETEIVVNFVDICPYSHAILRVFEKRVLRIFGPKRDDVKGVGGRKFHKCGAS